MLCLKETSTRHMELISRRITTMCFWISLPAVYGIITQNGDGCTGSTIDEMTERTGELFVSNDDNRDCDWTFHLPENLRANAIILHIMDVWIECNKGYLGFTDQYGPGCGLCEMVDNPTNFCQMYIEENACTEVEIWQAVALHYPQCTHTIIHRGTRDVSLHLVTTGANWREFTLEYTLHSCAGSTNPAVPVLGLGPPITKSILSSKFFPHNCPITLPQEEKTTSLFVKDDMTSGMSREENLLSTTENTYTTSVDDNTSYQTTTDSDIIKSTTETATTSSMLIANQPFTTEEDRLTEKTSTFDEDLTGERSHTSHSTERLQLNINIGRNIHNPANPSKVNSEMVKTSVGASTKSNMFTTSRPFTEEYTESKTITLNSKEDSSYAAYDIRSTEILRLVTTEDGSNRRSQPILSTPAFTEEYDETKTQNLNSNEDSSYAAYDIRSTEILRLVTTEEGSNRGRRPILSTGALYNRTLMLGDSMVTATEGYHTQSDQPRGKPSEDASNIWITVIILGVLLLLGIVTLIALIIRKKWHNDKYHSGTIHNT